MALARHYQTSVGTSATVIPGTQFPGYILQNKGSASIFLGSSGVTTGTGYEIPSGGVFSPPKESHDSLRGLDEDRLFGICASATQDVRVLVAGRLDR